MIAKKNKLKIGIYSGEIPSSTFIENLIKGISTKHEVLLFGKLIAQPTYTSENIQCFPMYSNKLKNLIITKWRTFLVLVLYPKRIKILWNQVKPIKGIYKKYRWWSRYIPVMLNLPDIFHIQWAKDITKWCFLKEKLDCKLVLSLRGTHINYSPIVDDQLAQTYNKYFSKMDAFHAVSDAIGLEAQKYGADPNKITTIHSLIPARILDSFKLPNEIQNKKLNIISVGRYHWIKGYSVALDALQILKEKGVSFQYTIIAAGKIPEELIFQRHQLDLKEEVFFLDALPQKKIFDKMEQSDVLLLTSHKEGIANVVLEAMALGVPVISTNCGGMHEVVLPNETGWLVPVLDPEILAQTLIEVLNISLMKRQEITKAACNLVKEKCSESKGIEQFLEFYDEVLKN